MNCPPMADSSAARINPPMALPRTKLHAIPDPSGCSSNSSNSSMMTMMMMMPPDHQFSKESYGSSSSCSDLVDMDMDMDMLLANAGYHVRASDLAHVARRLEQLESALSAAQEASISHLSSEAVHVNPSDLAGWVECMLGELSPTLPEVQEHSAITNSHDGRRTGDQFGASPPPLDSSSQLETSGSYVENSYHHTPHDQQPSAGSISSNVPELVCADAVGFEGPPCDGMDAYRIPDYSPTALLHHLGDYQYKALLDDQTSSTTQHNMDSFYTGIQVGGAVASAPVPDPPPQVPLFSDGCHMHLAGAPIALPTAPANMPTSTLQHQQRPFPQQMRDQPTRQLQDGGIGGTASSQRSSKVRASPSRQEQLPQPKRMRHDHRELQQHRAAPARTPSSALSINSPAVAFSQHQQKPLIPGVSGVQVQQSVVSADDDDAQESGIRLVHLLMACAKAVHNDEYAASVEMVGEIKRLASAPGNGTMGKVANKFVEALTARICGVSMEDWIAQNQKEAAISELLYHSFYETCPYLKFAHFTANQAILEAFEGHKFVHVIDFSLMQGLQWPALIQALALRPGGPPHLRLTGIGPPQPESALCEVGLWLAEIAKSVNVEFAFRVAPRLDDVKPWLLEVQQGEAIAINSIFQLHSLLYQGGPNATASIDQVLQSVRSLNPKVVTVVEQEANHNSPVFIDRFVQALHYYSTMFDSLDDCGLPPDCPQLLYSETYLGREIINVVACEGASRTERHEMLSRWRSRFSGAGFIPLHLGSNAFKQASMLLELFSGEGYTVEENAGCLTLGWHSRPLIASSAWQCG